MKAFTVTFTQESRDQLAELQLYIASSASINVAADYVSAIISYCEGLSTFPLRGALREDVTPGLRITSYRRRTVVAYIVNGDEVLILGVFHGGQNYEAWLVSDSADTPYAVDVSANTLPLTAAQRAELDRRLADHAANPDAVVPWEEVKTKLSKQLGM